MNRLQADVIVVAAGAAGLAASVAAAEKEVKVIAFEKASTTGGTGSMGMGPLGVESRRQRLKFLGPTKDEAFRIFMDYTHWQVDARLVRAYMDKAATTIDWLEDLGVEFEDPCAYFPGGHATWHPVKPGTEACAANMYRVLTERAKERGVQILLQTPVERLIKEGDRVVGVVAEDRNGEQIEARAKAVIIATGGFGDDPKLIKKYTGYEWGKDLQSFRIPGLEGDGIRMAWEAGAEKTEMRMELIYLMPGDINPELAEAFRQPHLLVNLLGERFLNEEIMPNTAFTGNAISRQKDRASFLIFDENIKNHMKTTKGFDFLHLVFPYTNARNFEALIKDAFDSGYEHVYEADSLEELAEKTGIDPAGLKATVEEYNRFCKNGFDPIFNKSRKYLRPVKEPRFYAGKQIPGAYGSLGGIKINYRTEVIDRNWNKIPGLYAAGTDACSIYGDTYVFILPGNTMGFALNSGRIAGEHAAEYAKAFKA
ncbi:MAG: FAD-binding protein [Deltaproteobacteria bacterium]|nr:MAG: FAD-binding protein [Deltaproteobacteria bacterium]